MQIRFGVLRLGMAGSFSKPWFEVLFDDGVMQHMRGRELSRSLIFVPSDYYDPHLFYYDFSDLNPTLLPGWVAAAADYLSTYGAALPPDWLDPTRNNAEAEAPREEEANMSIDELRSRTHSELQQYLLELSGEARAKSTIDGHKYPALKALWWWASQGRRLPPTPDDAAEYLAFLAKTINTTGAVECASNAIGYVCILNGWDKVSILGGRAHIPLDAMRRRHVHEVHKSAGLTVEHVRAIMHVYVSARLDLPWHLQWRLAFGIGAVTSYKVLARYNDLSQLRYDEGFFFVSPLLIELLCTTRKNKQEFSTRLAVARPADPNEFGVYNALILGKTIFGGGYIMPHIDALGVVHRERPMEYDDYVRFLRKGLISATGMAESEALLYAGQSARSGAASEAARSGMEPHRICHLAGVRDINWLLTYMRANTEDKMRASWALGL